MTGAEFSAYFQQRIDKAYSTFVPNSEQDRIFKDALYVSIEDKYRQMGDQRDYDAILSVIRTNKIFKVNNNKIHVQPIEITNISVLGLTLTVTTEIPHNLETGDTVVLFEVSGLTTTPTINGTDFTVTVVSETVFTFTVTAVGGTYTANTGRIIDHKLSGYQKMISDYLHILNVKTRFSYDVVTNYSLLTVTDATNSRPITLTLSTSNHNVKTTESITVSGIGGNTNANGTFYAKKKNSTKIELYHDIELTRPTLGNGDYIGGGKIKRVDYSYAAILFPNQKNSVYDMATINDPRYERGDMFLKFYPNTSICDEITVDYISNDVQLIESSNTSVNLENYYPYEFLMYILDKSIKIFAETYLAGELYQTASVSEAQNK
jgi:hypothetical protein